MQQAATSMRAPGVWAVLHVFNNFHAKIPKRSELKHEEEEIEPDEVEPALAWNLNRDLDFFVTTSLTALLLWAFTLSHHPHFFT